MDGLIVIVIKFLFFLINKKVIYQQINTVHNSIATTIKILKRYQLNPATPLASWIAGEVILFASSNAYANYNLHLPDEWAIASLIV